MTYVFKYNPEKKIEMIQMYLTGYNHYNLADIFQCDRTTIRHHINKLRKTYLYFEAKHINKRKNREYKTYEQNVIRLLRGCGII